MVASDILSEKTLENMRQVGIVAYGPTPIEIVVRRVVESWQENRADFPVTDDEYKKLNPLLDQYIHAAGIKEHKPSPQELIKRLLGWRNG